MKLKSSNIVSIKTGEAKDLKSVNMTLLESKKDMFAMYLRKSIYSDPILAVVREYTANAVDEHSKYSIDVPVDLYFTMEGGADYFHVRDYAKGLSEEGIYSLGQYGASTKTETNNEIGGFGIGSKCGHAYNSSFIVISRHEGLKSYYLFSLEGEGSVSKGKVTLISSEKMAEDELCGLEIKIPLVKSEDKGIFKSKIRDFLPYASNKFQLIDSLGNVEDVKWGKDYLDSLSLDKKGSVILFPYIPGTEYVPLKRCYSVLMGFIPYGVDSDVMEECFDNALSNVFGGGSNESVKTSLKDLIMNDSHVFIIRVPIGSMEPSLSREDIVIDSSSKNVITKIFEDLFLEEIKGKQEFLDSFNEYEDYEKLNTDGLINRREKGVFDFKWDLILKKILFKKELLEKAEKGLLFSSRMAKMSNNEHGDLLKTSCCPNMKRSSGIKRSSNEYQLENGNLIKDLKIPPNLFYERIPTITNRGLHFSVRDSLCGGYYFINAPKKDTLSVEIIFDESSPTQALKINEIIMGVIDDVFTKNKIKKTEKNLKNLQINTLFKARAIKSFNKCFEKGETDYNTDVFTQNLNSLINERKAFGRGSNVYEVGESSNKISREKFFSLFNIENSISISKTFFELGLDKEGLMIFTPIKTIPKNAIIATISGGSNDIVNLNENGSLDRFHFSSHKVDLNCLNTSKNSIINDESIKSICDLVKLFDFGRKIIISSRTNLRKSKENYIDFHKAIKDLKPSAVKENFCLASDLFGNVKNFYRDGSYKMNLLKSCASLTGDKMLEEAARDTLEEFHQKYSTDYVDYPLNALGYVSEDIKRKIAENSNKRSKKQIQPFIDKLNEMRKSSELCDTFMKLVEAFKVHANQLKALANHLTKQYNEYHR